MPDLDDDHNEYIIANLIYNPMIPNPNPKEMVHPFQPFDI